MAKFNAQKLAQKLIDALLGDHHHDDNEGILHSMINVLNVACSERGEKITDKAQKLISIVSHLSQKEREEVSNQYSLLFKIRG